MRKQGDFGRKPRWVYGETEEKLNVDSRFRGNDQKKRPVRLAAARSRLRPLGYRLCPDMRPATQKVGKHRDYAGQDGEARRVTPIHIIGVRLPRRPSASSQ